MVGYNDSRQLTHTFGGPREHLWGLSLAGLQLWNSIRGLDFLESLPYVKRDAMGITGESGGGTQTFMLAAADPRVAAAVPVNMISLHMQGGCLCENPPGLRLDTTNVEIAATIAPRPLLMVSATGDWTAETLELEYPAVRALYALAGAQDRVSAVRFTAEHNYNKDSREAMYGWMARWLKGAASSERVAEPSFSPDALPALLVFHGRPLAGRAVTADALTASWIESAKRQLAATPLAVRVAALRHALGFGAATTSRSPAAPRTRPPSVLVAGETPDVEAALRKAGYAVRPVAFTPFDQAAADKVRHFETYNRTAASQRVADIVAALGAEPGAILVASGDAALAGVLASAIEPPRLADPRRAGLRHQPRRRLPRAPLHSGPAPGWRRADGVGGRAGPARHPQRRAAVRRLRRTRATRAPHAGRDCRDCEAVSRRPRTLTREGVRGLPPRPEFRHAIQLGYRAAEFLGEVAPEVRRERLAQGVVVPQRAALGPLESQVDLIADDVVVGENGADVRELVRRRHQQAAPRRFGHVLQVGLLPDLPGLLRPRRRIRALFDDRRHRLAEVALNVHQPRLAAVVFRRVVQQGGDGGVLVAAVTKDDGTDLEEV